MKEAIKIWNREKNAYEDEKVFGGNILEWLYTTRAGGRLRSLVAGSPAFSQFYGWLQSRPQSRYRINEFIHEFNICEEEFEPGWKSFNDFFIRRFKPDRRPFISNSEDLPAFAEARYLGFERMLRDLPVAVKGFRINLPALVEKLEMVKLFEGGPCLIARLAPVDYHRFHFPDDGKVIDQWRIGGALDSVHPVALKSQPEILFRNERHLSLLETKNFGKLLYIEVGALCVGKIVQTYAGQSFFRGQEKGYFLFGGSTVILLGEPGSFEMDQDIIQQTKLGFEVKIKVGQKLGRRPLVK